MLDTLEKVEPAIATGGAAAHLLFTSAVYYGVSHRLATNLRLIC